MSTAPVLVVGATGNVVKHLLGSALFAAICELPEYYPSRTERLILEERAGEIAERTGAVEVVELGSGYATKTRVLLDALATAGTLRGC